MRQDPLLAWLELYETAFPAPERVLVSSLLKILKTRMDGGAVNEHLISAINAANNPVGLAMFSAAPGDPTAILWYLAVDPGRRNAGIGTQLYLEILSLVSTPGRQILIYEVEIPDGQDESASRRIRFYQRQGAFLLSGIHYMQSVGWHQPPIPMNLMVHPIQQVDAQQAYDLAKAVFGDALEQIDVLGLV